MQQTSSEGTPELVITLEILSNTETGEALSLLHETQVQVQVQVKFIVIYA